MKKRFSNKSIYFIIISVILAWLAVTTVLILFKYNILPLKYLIPAVGLIIVIPTVLIFFMLRKKIKRVIRYILSGFSIIFIILFSVILFYIYKTFRFLDNIVDDGLSLNTFSVLVLNNDKYNEINDIKDKSIGFYKREFSNIDEALIKLENVVNVNEVSFDEYNGLIDKLYNEEVDSILVEDSYMGIIEENYGSFSEDTKVIYKIETTGENVEIVKNVDVKNETFNVYISGIDTYGKISAVSRSDVNIIATINPTTHQVLLTTIPRDYYVQLDGTTGYKDKLTHAGIYGIEKSVKTLENLLDIEINYYIKVNFSSVERIVDALGGVEVYSDYTFIGYEDSSFSKGFNRVDGKQALEFARTRKTVPGGDRTRGINQEALIQAMLKKATSKDIIVKYTSLLNSLEGTFQTNMTTEYMTSIIKKQIDEMAPWTVTSISLDGTGGSEYTYSYAGSRLYVMIPDEDTILNAKEMIAEVTNGTILAGSYKENTGIAYNPYKVVTSQPEEVQEQENVEIDSGESSEVVDNLNNEIDSDEEIISDEHLSDENLSDDVTDSNQDNISTGEEESLTQNLEEINDENDSPVNQENSDVSLSEDGSGDSNQETNE